MNSQSVLRLVRHHWIVIALCAILGILAGGALAYTAQKEYTARSEVFVTVTGGSSTGEVAQSTNYSQQQARNFSAVATREIVLARVIEELDLDMTLGELRRIVSTSVPLNTTVIQISVTDTSSQRAADIANAVAENLAEVVPELTPSVDDDSPVRLQVIETAIAPRFPSAPDRGIYLFLGLLGGLVVASVVVVLRGMVYARVRTAEQITELIGATVIGSISRSRAAVRHPIAITSDSQVLRAEEYRQLRANLRFLQVGEDHKVFVITSSIPSEGKSGTAANLAAVLAASGQSVCLVEADLRRPSLADILDLPEAPGLTSVLMGEVPIEDALLEWGADGMKVLLAGDIPPNPSELLESDEAAAVIDTLRSRFDAVLIDSPPLNPVADASILARRFGGVILVVGSRRVHTQDLVHAAERLETVGATIEGAVLSMAPEREVGTYRYGYASRTPGQGSAPRHATRRTPIPVVRPGGDGSREQPPTDSAGAPKELASELSPGSGART